MKKQFLSLGIMLFALNMGTLFAASANISVEQAKTIALKKIPGGKIISIELDTERNRTIYDIDVVLNHYEYDLKLDAKTGSGISATKELRDDYIQASGFIPVKKAKAIALKKIPGSTVHKIELDSEAGRDIYEVELYLNKYEYDLKLDARTGSGISVTKKLKGSSTQSNAQTSKLISKEAAKTAALNKVPGASVTKIELDREDGVYELELRKGNVEYEVEVNAYTGKVVYCKIDS